LKLIGLGQERLVELRDDIDAGTGGLVVLAGLAAEEALALTDQAKPLAAGLKPAIRKTRRDLTVPSLVTRLQAN